MAFFDKIGKTLTETAKTVSKKSEELVEQTKMNMAIGSEEDKIKKLCEEIGSEMYKEFKNGRSFGDLFDQKFNLIKQCELNIEDLRNKVQGIKGTNLCKNCGASVDLDITFCPKCGSKVNGEAPSPEQTPSPTSNPTPANNSDFTIKPQ